MVFLSNSMPFFKDVYHRIVKRDFSGNTGLAIKNSMYLFSTGFVAKMGSLVFTIILARLLMPELFGLYSLALSTILVFGAISELGISQTLVRYVSKFLGKNNNKKAKAYVLYLGKIKGTLVIVSIFLLIIASKFISENYYQKPLFLALIAGAFYIIAVNVISFFSVILQSSNNFKNYFFQEFFFQISRIILVPLMVLYALKAYLSSELTIFYIIIAISVSYIPSIFYLWKSIKDKSLFMKSEAFAIPARERKETNRFIFAISSIILSGVFFANIDKIMLGRFVSTEFIGYYTASFSLIGALVVLAGFNAVLLPIFSRIKGKKLELALGKSLKIISLFSLLLFFAVAIFSPLIISIIYGPEYRLSVNILRLLSILLLLLPAAGVYTAYLTAINKPQIISKLLIASTLINIALNYILITSFLKFGEIMAVYGAVFATLISQAFYLAGLFVAKKRESQ